MKELKDKWNQCNKAHTDARAFDHASLQKILVARIRKQQHTSMKYFWASLTLQIIVYAMLSHIGIKHWADTAILAIAALCALLYVPFTVILLKKFKRIAVLKMGGKHTAGLSMYEYVAQQYALLSSFYRFKKSYELFLIPLSSAVLIWIFFRIYLPGGVIAHPVGATICFLLTLLSCFAVIVAENKKRFTQPLSRLEEILNELKN